MENTFRIPADVATHCIKAAYALAQSEKMMRRDLECWHDPDDADWYFQTPHENAERCADNLKAAHEFLHWLGQFAEADATEETPSD